MQAEVLPVPTAPKMATPVYRPRSGSVSQEGRVISRGSVGWWTSPTTRAGESSPGDVGQRGRVPRPKRRDRVREPNQRR